MGLGNKIITVEQNQKLYLLFQLTKKDIRQRYQGSVLGLLWSLVTPILMLIVYTIVYSKIFPSKWNVENNSTMNFALILFSGLNIINMMNDILNRSTTLIASNTNYVKKVIFPLEILPLTVVFSNLFNCLIGYAILFAANLILTQQISSTFWLLPVVLVPFILLAAGLAFLFSSISVFIKDLSSLMSIITLVLMYTCPLFFPLESITGAFRIVCNLNPLTAIIINIRNVTLYSRGIDLSYWLASLIVSVVVFYVGYSVFKKLKEGFSDVL